ncbi:MAG: hypothetical protein N3D80_06805 [Ignavibacterium album]|uniref:Uncharacterized protein n=1 Tax=Ignavibacterium album TaxID=591197 RepID=A0A7V2ZL33_9BACT|nr:hypothetical protein [Ignavibacterium album]MCX8105561.1 hypothetical protein [Ignavibacterium album]
MALKKPKEVPKLPKAREKTIDKLKKAIPKKKKEEIEFNCRIYFHSDKKTKKQKYRFQLETLKVFSALNYKISTQHRKSKNEIDISILGLTAQNDYLTKVQPATAEVDLEDLFGEYTLNIIKQDGSINSALLNFNIFKKEISLIKEFLPQKKNNGKFCTFEIDNSLFTFSNEFV